MHSHTNDWMHCHIDTTSTSTSNCASASSWSTSDDHVADSESVFHELLSIGNIMLDEYIPLFQESGITNDDMFVVLDDTTLQSIGMKSALDRALILHNLDMMKQSKSLLGQ